MWRVLSIVEQMSASLNDAAGYLADALHAIDQEMSLLQRRLSADAAELQKAVDLSELSDEDRAALLLALQRVETTATHVASFAHRHRAPATAPPPRRYPLDGR